jgi:CRISPR-associated protein Cas2
LSEKERGRFMRILVFFDLPIETAKQRKDYRTFRTKLLKEGYIMVQKSVYAKLATNENAVIAAIGRLEKIKPPEGLVQVLRVTERQFTTMACITGKAYEHDEIDSTDEILVL